MHFWILLTLSTVNLCVGVHRRWEFPFFLRSAASSTDDFTWKDICCCWLVSISAFNILKWYHLDNGRWMQNRISQYFFSLFKDRKRPANWDPNIMQLYSNAQIVSKPFKNHCVDICCLLIFYSIKSRRFSKIKIIVYLTTWALAPATDPQWDCQRS